ncbi:MAG TPA: RnfABCDGE type electron transport complex subunit D [Spirochaetota bacterium]|nr:RnfABCDGE type electron transport complex subunit D [Spirochaetota bacterium]HPQ54583.1 RnfABCDGE type electron transport complex subunit D [Spirochaetota bacterium]
MKKPQFLKQKVMLKVLYAMAPVAMTAVYYFGWRVAAILAVSFFSAFITEWIMASKRGGKITYACFVTAGLYGLSLPPATPFWIVAVGAVIAILFGKEVFGGFGRNVFNPAIVGRAFVYVSFPVELTSQFVPALRGFPGGFGEWTFTASRWGADFVHGAGLRMADAVTAATPMWARRDFGHVTDIGNLFFGNIGEVFQYRGFTKILAAGSAGEVCAAAILIGGIYLLVTKTAQWRLTVSTIAGAVLLNVILRHIAGIEAVPPVPFTLFSGALLFAAVFMVTDPISAPNDKLSQWIYGFFIGMLIVFFRYKSIFAGGAAFAILFGNILSPSLDFWIKRIRARRKEKNREQTQQ